MTFLKRVFNPLYVLALVLFAIMFSFHKKFQSAQEQFFGFAKTLESELNIDFPVYVDSILVKEGQLVSAGEVLLELDEVNLTNSITNDQLRIDELHAEVAEQINEIKNKIEIEEFEYDEERKRIDFEISEISNKIENFKTVKQSLKSIDIGSSSERGVQMGLELEKLEREKSDLKILKDTRISGLQQKLRDINRQFSKTTMRKESNVNYVKNQLEHLQLKAPEGSLIGNIHVKKGEFVKSFETMITLYEPHPTTVKGYVQEKLIVNVNLNDTLYLRSLVDETKTSMGTVSGLGSRVVEIPSRLRKFAKLKTYGREVIVSIDPSNRFLQNERVVLSFEPLPTSNAILIE